MYLKRNKQQIVVSIFFLCYIVYAISPISYTGSVNFSDSDDNTIQEEGMYSNNIGIFLLNVFFSNLNGKADDDANATLFLFKKIKATLQSPIDPKKTESEPDFLLGDQLDFKAVAVFSKEVCQQNLKYHDPLFFEFSGLSPPLA